MRVRYWLPPCKAQDCDSDRYEYHDYCLAHLNQWPNVVDKEQEAMS